MIINKKISMFGIVIIFILSNLNTVSSPLNIEIPLTVKEVIFHNEIFTCEEMFGLSGEKNCIGCAWKDTIQIINKEDFPDGYGGYDRMFAHEISHIIAQNEMTAGRSNTSNTEAEAWAWADSYLKNKTN